MKPPLLYHTESYAYLASPLAAAGHLETGQLLRKKFPDGERYLRVLDDVRGRDVVLLGGTISDADTLEIFDLASALVRYGARSLGLLVPYFGYSTMERAILPGEVVTAKTRARLLSAIPRAPQGNTAYLVDLHSEGIPHYFGDDIEARHLYAKPLILEAVAALPGENKVLAATDAGRAKWVESLARDAGLPAAFVYKRRLSGEETVVTGVNADVRGRDVILYDDLLRTGGSLEGAARAYLSAGAKSLCAVVTHLVPPAGALARLQASGLFTRLVCTDSHPKSQDVDPSFVELRSLAALLGASLSQPPL
jgi:ribose-phosphate pyrophosphokinase